MKDRDGWNLRGAIKICRLERTWYSRRCGTEACETEEHNDASVVEFRADGSLTFQQHRNPDGSEWTGLREYDESGRLTSIRSQDTKGRPSVQTYEYDSTGRLARIIAENEEGRERVAETNSYDPNGRRTKTTHIDVESQRPDVSYGYGVEGTDTSYGAPGAATIKTIYNDAGRPSDVLFHDLSGQLVVRVVFYYDEHGNLTEETHAQTEQVFSAEVRAQMNPAQLDALRSVLGSNKTLHKYDDNGRRIESRHEFGTLSMHRKTMAYNDYGDVITEISEDENREFGFDDEGKRSETPTSETKSRSEAQFRYEYDRHGNWITKTIESRSEQGQDFTVSSSERRTLEYFDNTERA